MADEKPVAAVVSSPTATGAPASVSPAPTPDAAAPVAAPTPPAEIGNISADSMKKDDAAKPAETKPTETKPAEVKAAEAPKPLADFKLPDGVEIDKEQMAAFKTLAQDTGLNQDAAQKYVDLHVAELRKAAEAPVQRWRDMQTEWQKQVKADPEIGGRNFDATRAGIGTLLDTYGSKGLREALTLTGFGNHPDAVRFFAKMSSALNEGKHVTGQPAGRNGKSFAETLYPNQGAPRGQE